MVLLSEGFCRPRADNRNDSMADMIKKVYLSEWKSAERRSVVAQLDLIHQSWSFDTHRLEDESKNGKARRPGPVDGSFFLVR